jgi:kanamycin nucleotidyltransferase
MPTGLKPHTHEERKKVIDQLLPQIKEKFGDNLIALAATASYARNDDGKYSDLELTAFLKSMPEGRHGVGIIHDGMLIELMWTTREKYLEEVKQVSEEFFLAGSDVMVPVVNESFIDELNQIKPTYSESELARHAKNYWSEVQESTSKVLKAIERNDHDAMPLVYWDMVRHSLILLTFLNAKPFTTFATFISEARQFPKKPSTFEQFIEPLNKGFGNLSVLEPTVLKTFGELEQLLLQTGQDPYKTELKLFS